jgi:hypothetical protein
MQAARRLYLYAMAGITLAVIAVGLATLIDVVITGTGILEHPYGGADSRQQLSQAIAMLGVGIPVWTVHWWIVQRGLATGRPDREAELGSPIRAAFVTIVLFVTLLIWVNAASSFVLALVVDRMPSLRDYANVDPISSASWGVVAVLIWLYYGFVRRGDLGAGPVSGAAAWIPRLYLYGVALGSLLAALASLGTVVNRAIGGGAFRDGYPGDDGYYVLQAIQSGLVVVAWGLVWFGHWRYADRIVRSDGWRGAAERESRTRVAAFVATIMGTAGMSLVFLALAIHELFSPLIVERPDGIEPVRVIAAAFLVAVPWLVAWWAHVRGLRREPMALDALRALHQERFVSHGVAAVALALGATGLGWLAGLAIDAALGGGRTSGGLRAIWVTEFSFWLPAAVLGLVVWAWHWRRVLARRRTDPAGEANSTIRRAFLYLTVAGALIVALATAALILYRIVNTVLGEALGGNAASELSTPLGILLAAVIVLAYHGLQLRADQARKPGPADVETSPASARAAAPATESAPASAPVPLGAATADVSERRALELVGPLGADLDSALAAARAALPPGVELVIRSA